MLLPRGDPDAAVSFDLGDKGNVYAVNHDRTNQRLKVWKRDLTTGRLATLLRDYALPEQPLYQSFGSIKVNNGILYAARKRLSDGLFEILTTDLNVPQASAPALQLLQSYAASSGGFIANDNVWGVDNGQLAFAINPVGSIKFSSIAVLDAATEVTQVYDMGSTTSIFNLTVLWRAAP